jgi:hypothetical protein
MRYCNFITAYKIISSGDFLFFNLLPDASAAGAKWYYYILELSTRLRLTSDKCYRRFIGHQTQMFDEG